MATPCWKVSATVAQWVPYLVGCHRDLPIVARVVHAGGQHWITHFRAFGFLVVPAVLPEARPRPWPPRSSRHNATPSARRTRSVAGTAGSKATSCRSWPTRTPLSARLVVDDGRLADLAETLLGGPVVPLHAEGILYLGEAGWH